MKHIYHFCFLPVPTKITSTFRLPSPTTGRWEWTTMCVNLNPVWDPISYNRGSEKWFGTTSSINGFFLTKFTASSLKYLESESHYKLRYILTDADMLVDVANGRLRRQVSVEALVNVRSVTNLHSANFELYKPIAKISFEWYSYWKHRWLKHESRCTVYWKRRK